MDEGSLEGLEETLIGADFGVPSTLRLVRVVETLAERGIARSQNAFQRGVREEIVAILSPGGRTRRCASTTTRGPPSF
jgi:fused signal recognition particle receptor